MLLQINSILLLILHSHFTLQCTMNQPHLPTTQFHNFCLPLPPLPSIQERLIKKLGPNAFPFFFELPPHCPASVTLQPAPGDMGKPCGVDYELKAYVGDNVDDKPHKRCVLCVCVFFLMLIYTVIKRTNLFFVRLKMNSNLYFDYFNVNNCVQELGATCHPQGDVRAHEAGRPAQRGGQQGVHDVTQQTPPRSITRQGGELC